MSTKKPKTPPPPPRDPTTPITLEERQEIMRRVDAGELSANSEEVRQVVALTHKDTPLTFARAFLKEHFSEKTPEFHQDIIRLLATSNRLAIAAPRGHAKSTVTSFAYVLHQALYEKKKSIVIISSSEDMAVRFLRRIRDELEVNKMLLWLFGDMKTDKWAETELRLANKTVLHAKGRGAQLRGLIDGASRPDLIILDDIEDEELVRSELRRLDLEQWFNGAVLPTLQPKVGQVVVIGTILHELSLLNRLLSPELYPDFTQRRFAAQDKDSGETLWPERFSKEDIEGIKKNYLARHQLPQFYMEYMNDPIPVEAAEFKPEYFSYFDELPKDGECFSELYVDMGGGSERTAKADKTAIAALVVDKWNNIYIHDYVNKAFGGDTKGFVDHLFLMVSKYNPRRVTVEKTVASNMVKAMIEAEQLKRRMFFTVEYVTPPRGSGDRRGNMSDAKFQRIVALASPMKMGVIKMRRWMTDLQEQLLAFPRAAHDDIADAIGYGWMLLSRRLLPAGQQPTAIGGWQDRPKEDEYTPLYEELGV